MSFCPNCKYECSTVDLGFNDEPVFNCPVDECPVELFRLLEGVNDYEAVKDDKSGGGSSE